MVELLEGIIVPVVSDVRETAGENDVAALAAATHHGLEKALVLIIAIDDSGGDDEVEAVVVPGREVLKLVDVVLNQLGVDSFVLGLLEHA